MLTSIISAVCLILPIFALPANPTGPVPNQYIVVLNPAVKSVDESLKTLFGPSLQSTTILRKFDLAGFKGFVFHGSKPVLTAFSDVAYVEQDQYVSVLETQSNAPWGISRIDQPGLPAGSIYDYSLTGEGVTSYVIDTGISIDHPDFEGRAVWGADFSGDGEGDGNGHGTHVAGTIGGKTFGVAKNTTLVAVRVLDSDGSGTWAGVVSGVEWAVKDAQSKRKGSIKAVANMSLGGSKSVAMDQAIKAATDAGLVFAVAAGNSAGDACDLSPAGVPSAITVGATDISDKIANFSERGSCVDIFAPGVNILSAWNDGNTNTISGTSMASPHVAGAVALLLEAKEFSTVDAVHDYMKTVSSKNKVSGSLNGAPNNFLYTKF